MKYLAIAFALLFIMSCQYNRIDKKAFEGKWQYAEKSAYKGVILKFTCTNDTLIGIIDSIPADNKVMQQYVNKGSEWIKDVSRKSNFLFEAKEAKPQIDFLKYSGLPSSTTFKMVLKNDSTIALAESGDPFKSKIILKKVY